MSNFSHNDNAKAIAIPRVFSENSRAKNVDYNLVETFSGKGEIKWKFPIYGWIYAHTCSESYIEFQCFLHERNVTLSEREQSSSKFRLHPPCSLNLI